MNADATPAADSVRCLLFDADGPDQRLSVDALDPARLTGRTLAWVDMTCDDVDAIDGLLQRFGAPCIPVRSLLERRAPPLFSQQHWFGARALTPRLDGEGALCHGEPWLMAVGPNVVVTVHRGQVDFLDELYDNADPLSGTGMLDADSFAATLLDRMLTTYFDAIDRFEQQLDTLEVRILEPRVRGSHLGDLRALRRAVSMLRRLLSSHRVLFDAVARADFRPGQDEAVARRFQALAMRYERVVDNVENARDLVIGSFELLATRLSQRTNDSMRILTFYTVLLGSLAVIVGALGMNFHARLFDTGSTGFWSVVAGMGVLVALALWLARRHHWWR